MIVRNEFAIRYLNQANRGYTLRKTNAYWMSRVLGYIARRGIEQCREAMKDDTDGPFKCSRGSMIGGKLT